MTIQMTEGFDMYSGTGTNTGLQAKWTPGAGGVSQISLVGGRFGGQAMQASATTGQNAYVIRSLPSVLGPSFAVGVAVRVTTFQFGGITVPQIQLASSTPGTNQLGLLIQADGSIQAQRAPSVGGTGTSIGTSSPGVILLNTWHYVEVVVTLNATNGTTTVFVDGTQVLNITTGSNTNSGTTFGALMLGAPSSSNSGGTNQFDDIYVNDVNTALGGRRVETLRAAADTATKNWTPNSGTANFSRANETLVDGDTSYVSASTVGTRDLYTLGALSSTPATIDAVTVVSFAEKTDATTRGIYNSVQSAGTDSDGSSFALAASYARLDRVMPTDPNGGGAWTPSRVNGLLIGPKVSV